MFIGEFKNLFGSVSFRIISKLRGKYKVIKTIGCASDCHKIDKLKLQARQEMTELQLQASWFHSANEELVEQISFAYTKRALKDDISVAFYDMTTLYFEASDKNDFRKTGFSKAGKHRLKHRV